MSVNLTCRKTPNNTDILTYANAGKEIEIVKIGHGPKPFIMIPGLGIKPISLSADMIAYTYQCFNDDYTIYCIDRRNEFDDSFTIDDIADDIAEVINYLGLKGNHVFGASLGGVVAQRLCEKYPDIAEKAIFASSFARPNEYSLSVGRELAKIADAGNPAEINNFFFSHMYSAQYCEMYKDALDAIKDDVSEDEKRKFIIIARQSRTFDYFDELSKIKAKVLVIGSLSDRMIGPYGCFEMAEKLGCEIYMYEGYSHCVYDEAPDYKDRIKRFFDGE